MYMEQSLRLSFAPSKNGNSYLQMGKQEQVFHIKEQLNSYKENSMILLTAQTSTQSQWDPIWSIASISGMPNI